MGVLPWVAGAFNIGSQIFDRSRAGYETSPQKRAFRDSVRHEAQIFARDSAYNSPSAQMQRFKDAGLNPNLIYGQGTPGITSGHNVQASGNIQPLQNVVTPIMEAMMFQKELELKDATIDQIRTNTKLLGTKTGSEDWKQKRMQQDWDYLENNYPELIDKLRRENRIGTATEEDQVWKTKSDAIHAGQLIETELLKQGLMEQDGTIKNEVLRGKELQNALMQMQKDFVESGKFNAQHFWQAVMMVLSKSLGR